MLPFFSEHRLLFPETFLFGLLFSGRDTYHSFQEIVIANVELFNNSLGDILVDLLLLKSGFCRADLAQQKHTAVPGFNIIIILIMKTIDIAPKNRMNGSLLWLQTTNNGK